MKKTLLSILSIFILTILSAQEVSQNILVEHYTNTRCGICASKNPALFTLLDNYDEIHIAYYPSAPYSTCLFSQHNSSEADARTNYYNIYGGTPRVVLNGEVVNNSTPILQESRMDAELPNMTPFTIDVVQDYLNSDSVRIVVDITTEAMTSLTNLKLHVMLVENEIAYNSPNGESTHPNVFRKALYGSTGMSITVPANGSSMSYEIDYAFDPDWIKEDMKVIVFLQDDSDKTAKQAAQSERLGTEDGTSPTSIQNIVFNDLKISPNPANNFIQIESDLNFTKDLKIYSIIGAEVNEFSINNNIINIQDLKSGIYFIHFEKDGKRYSNKFIKK